MTYEYLGYKIKVRRPGKWAALIYPPGCRLTMSEIPTATFEEGEAIFRERVKVAIEADIAAMKQART
ncbi:hypothetical protein ACIGFJ_17180 [Brevundimonas diminuta]|uniref:hypothetical protein n=1 Tax=Brevundimonas diminuta TaxID=293 RepID=UPI0037C50DB1